jgi:predicted ArsR family transcriptional regulator
MAARQAMAKQPAKSATRQAILDILKLDGPSEAADLAAKQGVSTMAVRQHLYALQEEGFVQYTESPRPVGRPAKIWALTESADRFFPDAHAELTAGLLGAMRATFGEEGLQKLIAERSAQQIRAYAARVDREDSVKGKLKALAEIRDSEGYMASVEEAEDGAYLLIENHCPICVAAQACSRLCDGELTVFRAVLGPHVSVDRADHLLAGARRCAYRVRARG